MEKIIKASFVPSLAHGFDDYMANNLENHAILWVI